LPLELFRGFLEGVSRRAAVSALPEKTSGETLPATPGKAKAEV